MKTSKANIIKKLELEFRLDESSSSSLLNQIVQINENEYSELVRINPLTNRGQSTKLKNITISIKDCLISVSQLSLNAFGVYTEPTLIPFAILITFNELWAKAKIEITPILGIVLQGLWENQGNRNVINGEKEALVLINKKLTSINKQKLSLSDMESLLSQLEKLKIIERKGYVIFLREAITFDSSF